MCNPATTTVIKATQHRGHLGRNAKMIKLLALGKTTRRLAQHGAAARKRKLIQARKISDSSGHRHLHSVAI
jgi:hypothetical protein